MNLCLASQLLLILTLILSPRDDVCRTGPPSSFLGENVNCNSPASRLSADTIRARAVVNGDAVFPAEAKGVGRGVREPFGALLRCW